jgi:hypothetical protein
VRLREGRGRLSVGKGLRVREKEVKVREGNGKV